MADTAAHLVDEVLPDVPIRQWVISFPFRIRYLLAYDPKLCCAVRRIFVRSGRRRLFGSHAKVLVSEGQRNRLEHLCRHVARPAIATQRLALSPDGRVIYGLRRHWRGGTCAVSFDPLTFIERLSAGSSSKRRKGVVAIRRCATNRGLPPRPRAISTPITECSLPRRPIAT